MKMDRNPTELRSLAAESSCIQLVYEWASCQMSSIYNWKNEEGYGTCPDHDWLIGQMNEMQIPGSPVMPDSVRDQIEDEFTWVLKQVTDWICYHHKKNFFHDEPASPLKEYLLKLIWKPDRWSRRSIDYTATAKNVLAGLNFNAMEKYRFACTYCFSEEVWNLKDMATIATDWCFETEPLLVYWSKCLTNQLHTITLPKYVPIEVIMFREAVEKYDLQAPVEYFFTKLNTGLKIWQCCDVITNSRSSEIKYLKELLPLMNEREKDLVYQDNMIEIVNTFLTQRNFESFGQMYSELKGKLNSTNYASIIEVLAKHSICYGDNFNSLTPLLMEIWNDAIGKDGFLENVRDLQSRIAIVYSIKISSPENRLNYCNLRDEFHRPLEFIRALASAYNPRNFLKSNFHWLVIWQPFASIVELIDEFQLDAADVEELKVHTRHPYTMMRRTCLKYLRSGKLDEFSAFVSFCYSDDNAIRIAYQEDLLMDEDGLKALAHGLNFRVDWRIVHKFVNYVFRDIDGFASVYTARLLFHVFETKTEYFLREMMEQGEANSVVECIRTLVPDDVNLSLAKQTFVDSYLKTLHNDSYFVFKLAAFNDMLIWCYGTDAGPAQFKEMINVSEVFVAQLVGCVRMCERTFEISDSMEEFLHWYYPVESQRRAFKLEMIHSNDVFETVAEFLKQRRYRRRMLNWFFENDADKITEFMAKTFH